MPVERGQSDDMRPPPLRQGDGYLACRGSSGQQRRARRATRRMASEVISSEHRGAIGGAGICWGPSWSRGTGGWRPSSFLASKAKMW
jgi:hypothetical protein